MPRINASNLADHRELMWNRLLEAFVVVLAEKGYPGLTLADVARHAGMARNSIYRYAPDKQALLMIVIEQRVERFVTELLRDLEGVSSPKEKLVLVVRRQLLSLDPRTGDPFGLSDIGSTLSPSAQTEVRTRFGPVSELVASIVADGIEQNEFRPFGDVRLTVALMGGVVDAARRAFQQPGSNRMRIIDQAVDFILSAVSTDPAGHGSGSPA